MYVDGFERLVELGQDYQGRGVTGGPLCPCGPFVPWWKNGQEGLQIGPCRAKGGKCERVDDCAQRGRTTWEQRMLQCASVLQQEWSNGHYERPPSPPGMR